jgi:hypothetical protein
VTDAPRAVGSGSPAETEEPGTKGGNYALAIRRKGTTPPSAVGTVTAHKAATLPNIGGPKEPYRQRPGLELIGLR